MHRPANPIEAALCRGVLLDAGIAALALLVMTHFGLVLAPDWQAEARPAVDALLGGHIHTFLAVAPTYGGSLILRAPFFLSTALWHGGDEAVYRASAVPCLLATGALGVWLSAQMRAKGTSTGARLLVLLLCVANPLALRALQVGHPEELLGAVLCVAAVLCALRGRAVWAAVLLGLAMANKEWAVLAVGPVLVALPAARVRTLVLAGCVAGAVVAPLLLGSSGGFVAQARAVGTHTGPIFQPWQLWWFFGSHPRDTLTAGHPLAAWRIAPNWLGDIGHTLPLAIMPLLTGLFALLGRHRGQRAGREVLLLLALLLALRCVLDPWDISYYALPFLLTLVTWESLGSRRAPLVGLVGTAAAWFVLRETSYSTFNLSPDAQSAIFTLVSIPAIAAMALAVYAPGVAQRLLPFSRRPVLAPAAT